MKRFFAVFLCCLSVLFLVACPDSTINLTDEEKWEQLTSQSYGTIAVSSEKTALNCLTGEYNMAQDRVGLRPYAVSVNNIDATWPQSGIAAADMIFEMETEAGITRFLCLYSDVREVPLIGAVRSLRHIQINATLQIDPVFVHIGTSIYADVAKAEYGLQTIDGDTTPSAIYIHRERRNAGYLVEYCKYTSGSLLEAAVDDLRINASSYSKFETFFNFVFPEERVTPSGCDAARVVFRYSSNVYDGDFRYDEATKTYLKYQRNNAQLDVGEGDGNTQLAFTNVLVLFAEINNIPNTDPVLVDVVYENGGKGYYFTDGRYEEIIWTKEDAYSSFTLTRADGTELFLNAGKTMVSIVRNANESTLVIS